MKRKDMFTTLEYWLGVKDALILILGTAFFGYIILRALNAALSRKADTEKQLSAQRKE